MRNDKPQDDGGRHRSREEREEPGYPVGNTDDSKRGRDKGGDQGDHAKKDR